MKTKFFSLLSFCVFAASSAFAVDTFFFMGGSDGAANIANDRSQWVNLSTYNSSGDTFLFQLFPKGTDDRVSTDKGNYRAGAISSDQSGMITSETNIIFNRYCLGEVQPDGSVAFNDANVKNPSPIIFNSDFTAGNMFARINWNVDFQFAEADSVTLRVSEINLNYISNAHFTKTTAGEAHIRVEGSFIWQGGDNLYLGSSSGFIDSFYAEFIEVWGPKTTAFTFNFYVNKIDAATTNFTSDDGNCAAVNFYINKLDASQALFYLGTTTKLDDSVINIDFSYLDTDGIGAGEYGILSVDSWSKGFAESGSLADFNINDDLLDAMGIEHNFEWDGQNLILNVTVPEPAEVAAVFGLLALFAAWRRRR